MGGWWESRGQRFSGVVYWQEKSINKNVFLCHESKLGIFNWERRNGIGSTLKSFDIIRVHWKIRFLGGEGSRKTKRGNCLKRERLGQFADLRGAWRKKGGVFLRGGWYPNAHYVTDLPELSETIFWNTCKQLLTVQSRFTQHISLNASQTARNFPPLHGFHKNQEICLAVEYYFSTKAQPQNVYILFSF